MGLHFAMVVFLTAIAGLIAPRSALAAEKAANERVVKDGMLVSMDYTLKGSDGKIIETSKGKEPMKYLHGQKMMIPGLEKELTGMKVGTEKNVTVKPEDAYGLVNPNAIFEIPKDKIPPERLKEIKVGSIIPLRAPDGQTHPFPVKEIKDKSIVVNVNHPMAGKTLIFAIKIVDIQPAPPPPPAVSSAPSAKTGEPAAPAKPAAPAQPAKPAEPAKK